MKIVSYVGIDFILPGHRSFTVEKDAVGVPVEAPEDLKEAKGFDELVASGIVKILSAPAVRTFPVVEEEPEEQEETPVESVQEKSPKKRKKE